MNPALRRRRPDTEITDPSRAMAALAAAAEELAQRAARLRATAEKMARETGRHRQRVHRCGICGRTGHRRETCANLTPEA